MNAPRTAHELDRDAAHGDTLADERKQEEIDAPRTCGNCVHYEQKEDEAHDRCMHRRAQIGFVRTLQQATCITMRVGTICGPDGKLWEYQP